jgi:preprotein translocase subunit SecD
MRWAALCLFLASPAVAEPALISFDFEDQSILATGDDIELAEQTFDQIGKPALTVQLHSGLDLRFAAISKKNIGKVMTLRICGEVIIEPVLQSQLLTANFIITMDSVEEATALAALLKTATCPDQPLG